jgi:sporulation protein YtfJ
MGDPINTQQGTTIIPISKISVGIATGGVDYNSKKENTPRPQNFGGGGGTGLTVSPVGFIVIDKDGDVEFINVGHKGKPDPVDQIADLVERTPDIISKIKDIFSKEPKETI